MYIPCFPHLNPLYPFLHTHFGRPAFKTHLPLFKQRIFLHRFTRTTNISFTFRIP